MKVSYIEIYKEELRDLLELNVDNKPDLHVREDDKGNTGKYFICSCLDFYDYFPHSASE